MNAPATGLLLLLAANVACPAASGFADKAGGRPTVVLLHGLARSASSMQPMQRALETAGYRVCNIAYPSRKHSIAELSSQFVAPAVADCAKDAAGPVNFVTHSLGGIIVRELANTRTDWTFGRVVMLGPPNQGSEVVDAIGDWRLFGAINGQAGRELGTSSDSVPRQLGPVAVQVGIVAGTRSINWINSLMIPGADDGKVSVERAKLEGMQDFITVSASHPFLMTDQVAIRQTLRFLESGCFAHGTDHEPRCSNAAGKSKAKMPLSQSLPGEGA
jgi:pimeloyl-ACP methyl ester carboxylesterase